MIRILVCLFFTFFLSCQAGSQYQIRPFSGNPNNRTEEMLDFLISDFLSIERRFNTLPQGEFTIEPLNNGKKYTNDSTVVPKANSIAYNFHVTIKNSVTNDRYYIYLGAETDTKSILVTMYNYKTLAIYHYDELKSINVTYIPYSQSSINLNFQKVLGLVDNMQLTEEIFNKTIKLGGLSKVVDHHLASLNVNDNDAVYDFMVTLRNQTAEGTYQEQVIVKFPVQGLYYGKLPPVFRVEKVIQVPNTESHQKENNKA